MMSDHALRIYLQAQAVVAQIEAMKAENQYRVDRGESIAYNEHDFFSCSRELQLLASEV